MAIEDPTSGIDVGMFLDGLVERLAPALPVLLPLIAIVVVLRSPLLGRGPGFQGRDPWRGFRFGARRTLLELAGGRCEGPLLLAWGRCRRAAEEVDHVYPWSKGGATIVSNGQALCHAHNSRKGSTTPAWWYVLSLERRRRTYYPAGTSVRVSAAMTDADKEARVVWAARRRPAI